MLSGNWPRPANLSATQRCLRNLSLLSMPRLRINAGGSLPPEELDRVRALLALAA